jgi:hypothetical protein
MQSILDALVAGTVLKDSTAHLLTRCQEGLLNAIDAVVNDNETYPQADLAERLANVGLLPMFGFPTRVRQLYHEEPRSFPPQHTIDRPLDIAISQFAPGSETVKDKTIYTAVGVVQYEHAWPRPRAVDGRGHQTRVMYCHCCGAFLRGSSATCPVCSAATPDFQSIMTWEPNRTIQRTRLRWPV